MIFDRRNERLEMEILSLRASLNHLIDLTNHMICLMIGGDAQPALEAMLRHQNIDVALAQQTFAGAGHKGAKGFFGKERFQINGDQAICPAGQTMRGPFRGSMYFHRPTMIDNGPACSIT